MTQHRLCLTLAALVATSFAWRITTAHASWPSTVATFVAFLLLVRGEKSATWIRRNSRLLLVGALVCAALWNYALMEGLRTGRIPADATISFTEVFVKEAGLVACER